MNRREFIGATAALVAQGAAPPSGIEPYFRSAAHQLVWRNWDLVPIERIATALGASRSTVQTLARGMGLG